MFPLTHPCSLASLPLLILSQCLIGPKVAEGDRDASSRVPRGATTGRLGFDSDPTTASGVGDQPGVVQSPPAQWLLKNLKNDHSIPVSVSTGGSAPPNYRCKAAFPTPTGPVI